MRLCRAKTSNAMSKSNKTKETNQLKAAKKATSKKAEPTAKKGKDTVPKGNNKQKKALTKKGLNSVEKSCLKLAKKLKKKKMVKVTIANKNNMHSTLRVTKFAWGLPKPGVNTITVVLTVQVKNKKGKWKDNRKTERKLSAIKSIRLK
jgi:hypothetical protein